LYHPDKNHDANATDLFREVSKAHDVLSVEATKNQFDQYLDNPSAILYWQFSGSYYYKETLKLDKKYVIVILLLLFSIVTYTMQKKRNDIFISSLLDVFKTDPEKYRAARLMHIRKEMEDLGNDMKACMNKKATNKETKELQESQMIEYSEAFNYLGGTYQVIKT
jgi:curved DNA-binding protein CbpA